MPDQESASSAKLSVMLGLINQAETEEQWQKAKQRISEIAAIPDDQVMALAGSGLDQTTSQVPAQHARRHDTDDNFLAYLLGGERVSHARAEEKNGATKEEPSAWDEARALARFYAGLFTGLETAGVSPAAGEVAQAREEELEPFGWSVKRHGDRKWFATDVGEAEHYRRVAKDTPGAVQRFNSMGQEYWIDADQASREAQKKKSKPGSRGGKAPVDRPALRSRLRALAGYLKLSEQGKQRARQALAHLERVYQERTLHRLDELTSLAENAVAKAPGLPEKMLVLRQLVKLKYMEQVLGEGEGGQEEEGDAAVEVVKETAIGEVPQKNGAEEKEGRKRELLDAAERARDPHTKKSLKKQAEEMA